MNNETQSMNNEKGTKPAGGNPNKAIAIIGYIIPILFFIPLLSDAKNDKYAKFHANQQLNLLLFWVALNVIGPIPIIGWMIYPIGAILGIVLAVMGVINASNEQQKPLPIIGQFSLLQ